jgi:hypothetical protein
MACLRDLAVFYTIDLNQEIYIMKNLNELYNIDFENLSENICPQISFLKLEIDKVPELYKDSLNNYFSDLNLNKNNFLLMYLIIFHMKQVNQLIVMMQKN